MATCHFAVLVILLVTTVWIDSSEALPCPPAGCTEPPTGAVLRARRDVMETMKQAWNDMTATLMETGEKIKYTFSPTTSRIDGMVDSIQHLG